MLENLFIQTFCVSVQMALLLLPLFVTDRWLTRTFSSQAKCFLWLVFGVRLLIPITFVFPLSKGNATMQGSAGTISSAGSQAAYPQPDVLSQAFPPSPIHTLDAPIKPFYEHLSLLEGLALIWIMGSICFLFAHIGLYLFHIWFLKKSGESSLSREQSILLEQVRKDMHIRRDIPVRISSHAEGPMILGLFCPVLILPQMELSQQQLVFIFRHELAHYKRRDLWIKWVFLLAQSVHWFNPLAHILAKKANLDLENACDDTVLKGKSRLYRKEYGTVLLEVLTEQSHRVPLSTNFSGKKKEMVRRFQNIVHPSSKRNGHILIVCIAAGLILLTSSLNPASVQALNPSVLSQLKAARTTPEERAATKALLTECLKGSMFETYQPFRDLPLTDENYQRCEQAEESYRSLLEKVSPAMQTREYTNHPFFLAVDSKKKGEITSGLFCCQADNQVDQGQIMLIELEFSDPFHPEVFEIGTAFACQGEQLNQRYFQRQSEKRHIQTIAEQFQIDLSQYEEAFSTVYPSVIQNQAYLLGGSIKKQLAQMGRYSFEKFSLNHTWAYIKKDHTEGVLFNQDGNGIYAHFFRMGAYTDRSKISGEENWYPIIENRCIPQ